MLSESFGHAVFKDSVRRVFHSGDYDLGLSSKYSFMNFVLYFFLSRIADYLSLACFNYYYSTLQKIAIACQVDICLHAWS